MREKDDISFVKLEPELMKREGFETIKKAYYYAEEAHKGMDRLTGDPFITHPLQVVKILMDLNVDDTTLVGAMLHEVINNANVTYDDLVTSFFNKDSKWIFFQYKLV